MLGYLSVNGSLTFKKSYYDKDFYNTEYLLQNTKTHQGYRRLKLLFDINEYINLPLNESSLLVLKKYLKRGNPNLISKKGKGSRQYRMTRVSRKKLECSTLLMRYKQDKKKYVIKVLTLTFKTKPKNANKSITEFFNHLRNIGIVSSYWWVKEYHPEHYKNYGIKKEHFHCLVCIKRYTTKERILQIWQQKKYVTKGTFMIKLENIRVRNKYNSFNYQIVMYVTKYCSKSIDSFSTPVYNMSNSLRSKNLPLIYPQIIDFLLKSISKNENKTVNDIIYYREHCNQAFIKRNKVDMYMKLKKYLEKDKLYKELYYE